MIITELFYNDPITGKSVSKDAIHYVKVPENLVVIDFDLRDKDGNKSLKKVEQVEPNDTINDISEHSHLTAKQIMAHLEGYFDSVSIKSPEVTMAELSHFIPRTVTELCDFMKLYIPGDDILLRINQEQTVTKYCENDVKATEDSFSKYMNPPVSDISVTTKPEE